MDEILGEDMPRGAVEVVRVLEVEIARKDLQHVPAALGDVVGEELDPVGAHEAEQGVVALLEVGLTELELDRSQLPLEDAHEEVAAAAGGFEEPRVDALALGLHEVEHGIDHPGRSEHLSVSCDALL